ncbi:GNAT family N-acetyltransferase [Streptomyces sp. CB02460]|uniref:GNAT family N-acetyltransferase n=1 Tax=Streptomyces sp. CB02460 TaxID=1703941 RepID=UPI00093B7E09|nr:GNAT family protein [Streptomyces sp. CB02460]OKJ66504.1 acetyltransferase [Streptomyces sp. CB02460]
MYPISRTSARLGLRELAYEDVGAMLAIYGSAAATEHMSFAPRTRDQVEQIVSGFVASATQTPRNLYGLGVVRQDSGEVIGFGRLATDPHQQRGATMGFALRPDTWGAGLGLETVQLLLGLGFEELEFHRIWGARSPRNAASAKTLTAAGMVEEGVIREHILKAGQWRDSIVHAILDHEWEDQPAQ